MSVKREVIFAKYNTKSNAHLDVDEHSIWETLMFQVATVVVVPIVNANVEAVADRACSKYTNHMKSKT